MKREVSVEGVLYLLLDWKEIDRMINKLADKIEKRPGKPDLIIGVLRGGAVVAALLSDRLNIHNIRSIGARLYQRTGKIGEKIDLYQPLSMSDLSRFDVLVVDDVIDTGTTYTNVLQQQIYPKKPRSLCTISLHIKPWAKYRPDIYLKETECWIWYPWETYDAGRDVYSDLCKSHSPEIARKIMLEQLKLGPAIIKRIAKSSCSK
jgi:hypoxanthine phosphoribosyltransferase